MASFFTRCPVCDRNVPTRAINCHVEACLFEREGGEKQRRDGDAWGESETAVGVRHSQVVRSRKRTREEQEDKEDIAGDAHHPTVYESELRQNAFAIMMSSSKAANERVTDRRASTNDAVAQQSSASGGLSGHFVFEDFISKSEEIELIQKLDQDSKNAWKLRNFNGLAWGKVREC